MCDQLNHTAPQDVWLAQSVEPAALHFGVMSSGHTLDVETTGKKIIKHTAPRGQ